MDEGVLYERVLKDGRTIFVFPLTYDRARVAIGHSMFMDDVW